MSIYRTISRNRNGSGSIAIDFAVGALITTALMMFAVDLVLVMLGYSSNDAACRDAARAAGATDSVGDATTAAKDACLSHHTDGFLVTQPQLDTQNFHFVSAPNVDMPYVYATTTCRATVPGCEFFLGDKTNTLPLRREYVFPALAFIQHAPPWQSPSITTVVLASNSGLPLHDNSVASMGSSDPVAGSE